MSPYAGRQSLERHDGGDRLQASSHRRIRLIDKYGKARPPTTAFLNELTTGECLAAGLNPVIHQEYEIGGCYCPSLHDKLGLVAAPVRGSTNSRLCTWMDCAALADWYEASAELKRGWRPEDEPARLDPRDLRHADRLERRSESLDRPCEEGPVREQSEYVGVAVDPLEPAQELVGEPHWRSILGEAPVVVRPGFRGVGREISGRASWHVCRSRAGPVRASRSASRSKLSTSRWEKTVSSQR